MSLCQELPARIQHYLISPALCVKNIFITLAYEDPVRHTHMLSIHEKAISKPYPAAMVPWVCVISSMPADLREYGNYLWHAEGTDQFEWILRQYSCTLLPQVRQPDGPLAPKQACLHSDVSATWCRLRRRINPTSSDLQRADHS